MREDKPLTLAEQFFDCRDGAWRACPHKRRLDSEPFSVRSFFFIRFQLQLLQKKVKESIYKLRDHGWLNEVQRIFYTFVSPLLSTQNDLLRSRS